MTRLFLSVVLVSLIPASTRDEPVHKFHVTYGRMAVEGRAAVCEIRFFKHDLEDALARFGGRSEWRLSAAEEPDSLFLTYLDSTFVVALNGRRAPAALSGSGEETVGQEEMWWYTVQYESEEPIVSLDVKSRLLFELFEDQRNILKVQHFPSEKRATFYFVPDSDHQEVEFPA